MEQGKSKAVTEKPSGYIHILEEHELDFKNVGISKDNIIDVIMKAVYDENIIGYQGKENGRPIYSVYYKGKTYHIAIDVSSNGYIVGANPNTRK